MQEQCNPYNSFSIEPDEQKMLAGWTISAELRASIKIVYFTSLDLYALRNGQTAYELLHKTADKDHIRQVARENYIRHIAQRTYFALKRAERMEWDRDDETFLPSMKRAFDLGYGPAFEYCLAFCEQTKTPKDAWLTVPVKKKPGRPKEWLRNLEVFVQVNIHRRHIRGIGRSRIPRLVSEGLALKIVREKRFPDQVFGEDDDRHLKTLGRAYLEARKSFSTIE